MSDAAHGELLEHPVYQHPRSVVLTFEMWDTPDNYKRRPGGENLPDKIKVWRVQNSGKKYGSVVSRFWGFEDSPDAEIIAYGYNSGKEYHAVGIGRQGNFLQWGFSCSPAKMTPAGRNLFLNCIEYIYQFNGQKPLIRNGRGSRLGVLNLAPIINRISSDQEKFFKRNFDPALYDRYKNDPEGLAKLYRENIELVYRDQGFRIDAELKSLGLKSNRSLATLETLIDLLDQPDKAPTARTLLERYTKQSFSEKNQWLQWYEQNYNEIYFSDAAGYKFMTMPKNYFER